MDAILQVLSQWGPMGVVCAALFWLVVNLQKNLARIIEDNTRAMTELRDIVHRLAEKLDK